MKYRVRRMWFDFTIDHMCIGVIWDAMGFGTYFMRVIFLGCMWTFVIEQEYVPRSVDTGNWLDTQMPEEEGEETTYDQN